MLLSVLVSNRITTSTVNLPTFTALFRRIKYFVVRLLPYTESQSPKGDPQCETLSSKLPVLTNNHGITYIFNLDLYFPVWWLIFSGFLSKGDIFEYRVWLYWRRSNWIKESRWNYREFRFFFTRFIQKELQDIWNVWGSWYTNSLCKWTGKESANGPKTKSSVIFSKLKLGRKKLGYAMIFSMKNIEYFISNNEISQWF